MLKTSCLHPEIISVLARCGHGDQVLIADGNYPVESGSHAQTKKVYLGLTHGIPLVTDILQVLTSSIEIEKAEIMVPDDGKRLPIHEEFQRLIHSVPQLDALGRFEFYEAAKRECVKLIVASGDQRVYANLLLTVGVVKPS